MPWHTPLAISSSCLGQFRKAKVGNFSRAPKHAASCRHLDSGADTVAIACFSFQFQVQPMRSPWGLSFNHNSAGALKVVVNNVQAAVAIQVAVDVQRGEFHIRRSSLGSSMTSESWPTSFTSKSRLLAMRQYA
jgi:hypothetical protein